MTSSYAAEYNKEASRAKLVLTIFSSIGLGATASGIVYVILLEAFKSSIQDNVSHLQWVWRLLLGIGLIPLILTLYARLTIKESKPYEECKSNRL
jgi:PHS family inorganic phosphate transporter-like MFS transporter